jgi:hypothetical protein
VPFRKTAPAAGRSGVLRDEHGMALERRLLAVVRRVRRTQSPTYDIVRMAEDGIESVAFQVSQLFGAEPEPPPERRRLELLENLVDVLRSGLRQSKVTADARTTISSCRKSRSN